MKLFLLQTGASANFEFDFSQMPFINLITIIIAILLIIFFILFVFVKYVKKVGPIGVHQEGNHSIDISIEILNNELKKEDLIFRSKLQSITSILKPRIMNIFEGPGICPSSKIALINSIPKILQDAVYNNHFSIELSSENKSRYLEYILTLIQDQYVELYNSLISTMCDNTLPEWNVIKENISSILVNWSDKIISEEIKFIKSNIMIYEKYKSIFKSNEPLINKINDNIKRYQEVLNQFDGKWRS